MPRVVSKADLEEAGFTAPQIDRLDQLKANYPFLEFTDSIDEFRRLNFLKWRVRHGHVAE
jgi:hypothetical protein